MSDERVYELSEHIDYMLSEGLDSLEVEPCEPVPSYYYCSEFDHVAEKEDGVCGKSCKKYKPRNGKSGICKFQGKAWESIPGESFTIYAKDYK